MHARRLLFLLVVFLLVVVIGIPWLLVQPGEPGDPAAPAPVGALDRLDVPVRIFHKETNTVITLPLEEYVAGVVAAEMPASFAPEALKAQAVASRTYAVVHMRLFGGGGCPKHPEADVCSDPAEGQAWASQDTLRRRWGGARYPAYWRKVREAVTQTRGLIVVYANRPIEAVFHAASGGRTEDAKWVWGRAVPYLQSVPSPGESAARYQAARVAFSLSDLAARTSVPLNEITTLKGQGKPTVAILGRTPSGRVAKARIGRKEFTGKEVRQMLGLNSTMFNWRLSGNNLEVSADGYGHGVGMSQYGADALARQGMDYVAIIRYYYRGTQVRALFTE